MKVKSFKVREIDGEVAKVLTDKQAGELYKAICAYNFNNEDYKGKDSLVKSVFALMKDEFEKHKFFRETGKQGGVKSASMRRESDLLGPCVARAVIGGELVNDMLKGIFGDLEKTENPNKADVAESVVNRKKT